MSLRRELDRRQVSIRDGHRSLKEWAAGRVDLAAETVAALVSTARRLVELPEVDHAVATGVIGFDVMNEMAGYDVTGIRSRGARRRRMSRVDGVFAFNAGSLVPEPNLDGSAWRVNDPLPGVTGRIVMLRRRFRGGTDERRGRRHG